MENGREPCCRRAPGNREAGMTMPASLFFTLTYCVIVNLPLFSITWPPTLSLVRILSS